MENKNGQSQGPDAPVEQFFTFGEMPFTRRGAYVGVYADRMSNNKYSTSKVFISSKRGSAGGGWPKTLLTFDILHGGVKVPYSIQTTPTQLILSTRYGNVYFCFAETTLLYIKTDPGLGVTLIAPRDLMDGHGVIRNCGSTAWECLIPRICSFVYKPIIGSLTIDALWEWERLCTPHAQVTLEPSSTGSLLAIEEFMFAGHERDVYPGYEQALANVTADWEAFYAGFEPFPDEVDSLRPRAAWMLWSHLVGPSGKVKRSLMYMMQNDCASSWQMNQNAVALHHNLELSMDLMLNMLDEAIESTGQLPDMYTDSTGGYHDMHPPLQGWGLLQLMKLHDLVKEVSRDKLEWMYTGYGRWADWLVEYRDRNHRGILRYEHATECGLDDSTVFIKSHMMESPDLSAYGALLFESLGDLGKVLGKDAGEYTHWYDKSKRMIDKLISELWNGERFIAKVSGTGEVVATNSVMYYIPIILGKRLPQKIIDKMASDLAVEGDWLTPYGFASEKLNSDYYNDNCMMAIGGPIAPTNLLLIDGLFEADKTEFAAMVAKRYCISGKEHCLSFKINSRDGSRHPSSHSWSASVYVIICNRLTEYLKTGK
ncbi:hypothetical protein FACS1894109_16500 [Spirochaetia bacterium]|nr:hypothetical protein FACS1894109_16500 [Spirochaetia bacterium]